MRQQGQDEMDRMFQTVLTHIRLGTIIKEDWQFMQSRVVANLSIEEQEFRNAIALYTTNDEVTEKNITKLEMVGIQWHVSKHSIMAF